VRGKQQNNRKKREKRGSGWDLVVCEHAGVRGLQPPLKVAKEETEKTLGKKTEGVPYIPVIGRVQTGKKWTQRKRGVLGAG